MRNYRSDALKDRISLSRSIVARDITCLLEVSGIHAGNEVLINRLISILRRNGYSTIEDVLNVSEREIRLIKHMGEHTCRLLLDLLKALSESEKYEHTGCSKK